MLQREEQLHIKEVCMYVHVLQLGRTEGALDLPHTPQLKAATSLRTVI